MCKFAAVYRGSFNESKNNVFGCGLAAIPIQMMYKVKTKKTIINVLVPQTLEITSLMLLQWEDLGVCTVQHLDYGLRTISDHMSDSRLSRWNVGIAAQHTETSLLDCSLFYWFQQHALLICFATGRIYSPLPLHKLEVKICQCWFHVCVCL